MSINKIPARATTNLNRGKSLAFNKYQLNDIIINVFALRPTVKK